MDVKAIEHLAHAAWLLSDHGCKDLLELAVNILSKAEDEIDNLIGDLTDWKSRISDRCYYTERRLEMLGEVKRSLATTIREQQDNKELTRRAIILLEQLGENADDLRAEFQAIYGEEV